MAAELRERAEELQRGLGFAVVPFPFEGDVAAEIARIKGDPVIVGADDLAKVLNPPFHVLDINDEGGWAIQHPLACRPNILGCSVHAALMTASENEEGIIGADGRPLRKGSYRVRTSRSGAIYAEPLDGKTKRR